MFKIIACVGVVYLAVLGVADVANAVPGFANQTGKECSYCHSAWPQLNTKGRAYKEAGYRLAKQVGVDAADFLETINPLSLLVVGRPYDRRDTGDAVTNKNRALHEVEIFLAGPIGKNFSVFAEVEYEDEIDDSFGQELAAATFTYTYSKELNLQLNWGDPLWTDPYGFLSDHFRLTRGSAAVIGQSGGNADGSLSSTRQNLTLYGRAFDRVFYSLSHSGEADDSEGVNANYIFARAAVDILPNLMVGGFLKDGKSEDEIGGAVFDRDSTRAGVDFQLDAFNTRLQGAFVKMEDDTSALMPVGEDNDVYSLQVTHFMKDEAGRPTWVPTVRYDSFEQQDGADEFNELTLNLGYYFLENMKVYLEYWKQLDVPTGRQEQERITFQVFIGF